MGYGDYLMLAGRARATQQLTHKKCTVSSREGTFFYKEVFRSNPHIVMSGSPEALGAIDLPFPAHGHVDHVGARIHWAPWDEPPIPGTIFFSHAEIERAEQIIKRVQMFTKDKPLIWINPFAKDGEIINGTWVAYDWRTNKEWPFDKWIETVRAMSSDFGFITANYGNRPHVPGTIVVPTESWREAAAIMAMCDAYVGCEGGMHHTAAALGKRGVVIFGHWISPMLTGYAIHDNVYRGHLASACGALTKCTECAEVMASIEPSEITSRLGSIFL